MTDLRKAANMALNALEFSLPAIEDFGSKEQLTDCHRAIMALYKSLAQPEPVVNGRDSSPCPEFWDWLPKAYNFEGLGEFTKYNMEVAFLAGKNTALAQPEQEEVKVDIGVDVTAAGTSVVAFNCRADGARECFYAEWHPMPKRVPVEWDDDEWVKKAMEMSRDFVANAKKNWDSPPKGVGTVTMAELRKTDLYRKVQTQLLRDILRDDNT